MIHVILNDFCFIERLKEVLQVEPRNGNVTSNLGIVYYDLERDAEAEEYFNLTLDIAPKDKQTLYNLGSLKARQERCHKCLAT